MHAAENDDFVRSCSPARGQKFSVSTLIVHEKEGRELRSYQTVIKALLH